MMGHDPKSRVASIAVFLLPLLIVKGGALLLRDDAQKAQGASLGGDVPPALVAPELPPAWTAVQQMAAHHIASLRAMPFGPSPLYHPRSASTTVDPGTEDGPTDTKVIEPPPALTVQMILTTQGDGDVALIDRKRYRVGDPIAGTGWVVMKIDSQTRSVIIHHPPTGRTAPLPVPLPR